jgi:hypothetical protein
VLKQVLHDWRSNEGNRQDVALHLLCAAGMTVKAESVASRPNGYILRNDGIANPGARSELIQVRRYVWEPLGLTRLNTTYSDMSGFAELNAAVPAETTVDVPSGPLRVPSKDAYSEFAQRVVYYPRLNMP